jgi:hypothetical protein
MLIKPMQQGAKMKNHRLGKSRRQVLVICRPTWHIASGHRAIEVDSAEMFNILDLLEAQKTAKGEVVDYQLPSRVEEGAAGGSARPYYEKRSVAVVACSPFSAGSLPHLHTAGGRVWQRIRASYHAGPGQTGSQFLLRRPGLVAVPKTSAP